MNLAFAHTAAVVMRIEIRNLTVRCASELLFQDLIANVVVEHARSKRSKRK